MLIQKSHTWRENHITPVVHVILIAFVAVIIPIQILLHILVAGHIIGVVGVMRQAEAGSGAGHHTSCGTGHTGTDLPGKGSRWEVTLGML